MLKRNNNLKLKYKSILEWLSGRNTSIYIELQTFLEKNKNTE